MHLNASPGPIAIALDFDLDFALDFALDFGLVLPDNVVRMLNNASEWARKNCCRL